MALEGGGTQKAVTAKKKTPISGASYVKFLQSIPTRLSGLAQLGADAQKRVAAATKPPDPFSALANAIRGATASSAGSDSAASGLSAQLQRESLAEQKRQFGITTAEQQRQFNAQQALAAQQQKFSQQDTMTQRLLEAAGLATSPTGAIQLAYMARGKGAPVSQIRSIFQNLPFVQALLQGKTLPGFGLPEQLGAATARVTNNAIAGGHATKGQTFGTVLPTATGVTQQQYEGLTPQEQDFLGALHTAETGQSSGEFFQQMLKGFIPTTGSSAALAF